MPLAGGLVEPGQEIATEDLLRAQCYRLLARFLSSPPTPEELRAASTLTPDESDFGRAVAAFTHLCARADPAAVAEEYHTLFIGLARGELVPYGSFYLTGFLQEKPLAKLRQDMDRLGVRRDSSVHDPEDHIASLCEMMAGFIDGTFGTPLTLAEQQRFFTAHIGCWVPVFFRDLEIAKASVVYAALGSVGRIFMAIEENAFAMS